MRSAFRWARRLLEVDHPSALLKQLPTAVMTVLAAVVILAIPGVPVTNLILTSGGISLVVIATVVALILSRVPGAQKAEILVPLVDLLALGALRTGTGGGESLFGGLIILPVVWIAAKTGRKYILIAALGTAAALMMQYFFGARLPTSNLDLVRGVFSPLVFLFAAAIINELSRQSRVQLVAVRRLADEREQIVQRTSEYARQLEESETRFREADRMFRGVWAAVTEQSVIGTDVTGLIDAWNPGATKLLGLPWQQTEGIRYVFDFHVAEELDERSRELNYPPGATVLNPGFSALVEMARLGDAESREWTYRREDGTTLPVSLSVTKRVDDAGEIVGYLFVAVDVTQAREVARLKDEFVGLISHELRTPLSSILGYLELIKDDDEHPLSEEQMRYLGVAERNAHRLLRLVGDLLFTAQVESGKFPLEIQDVELGHVLGASVESARPIADAAGVALQHEAVDEDLTVRADPLRLGQAFDNLISNALKFTPRGGTVTVSLRHDGAVAEITVRDTGMGIAAADLDQLFGRFFRASTATRNAVPGVGLGLTITKAIVIAHHGHMDVESEEGVGTCFTMTLPVAMASDTDGD